MIRTITSPATMRTATAEITVMNCVEKRRISGVDQETGPYGG